MIKTKVLCLFPRFYIGGVSKALSFVANTCDEAGMEVHCVSMTSEPETIQLNQGIVRYRIDTERRDSAINYFIHKVFFILKFRKLADHIKPDVIVAFRPDLAKAAQYATSGMNIPIIGSERGNPLLYGKKLRLFNKVFNRCAAVVFQTEAARDVYNITTKSVIIPNPAVTRNNGDKEKHIRTGQNIVTVSRLSSEKNIEGLLHAFALIKEKISGRKLILYGDGPQQDELEKLASDLHIENDVMFVGNVKDFTTQNDDASIFVLNTLSEGMPNALIEAMLSGYTCICTDCPVGAPRWLSDDGRRVKLVPLKDDIKLSQAILEVINNQDLAKSLAYNALEVGDLLNPKKISELWLNLIKEVVDENRK